MIAGPVHVDLGDLAQVLLAVAAVIAAWKGRAKQREEKKSGKSSRKED